MAPSTATLGLPSLLPLALAFLIPALLDQAFSGAPPFDIILVDDTSRLARDIADAMRLYQRLNFSDIRVVAVSQGIDTASEQADVLVTVHGLVDSLYVKELAKKTHRGLEGRVLHGFHARGRCFGYQNVKAHDGVRLEINHVEAPLVHRIFEMYAGGASLKGVAKALNAEQVSPPRPRAGKKYATWCPSGIREMLRRELYAGRIVWNQSRFVKVPGTNRRVRRERPQSEWRIVERPELRIIPIDLWEKVQERVKAVGEMFGNNGKAGLLARSATSPYLLTGFLKCGQCGANLAIVTGRGPGRKSKYGCPQNFYRGACPNDLKENKEQIEERLLAELQNRVLTPEVIDFALEEFGRQLSLKLLDLSDGLSRLRERRSQLEAELRRLADAAAQNGASRFLLDAIGEREKALCEISNQLLSDSPQSVDAELAEIRGYVTTRLADIRSLLAKNVPLARVELAKHVREIRMQPSTVGAERFYVAEGEWNLLGSFPGTGPTRQPSDWRVRMVAGAGFEPATFGL
jgi:DNA invertase Pin-like site-specific DNA recombinase